MTLALPLCPGHTEVSHANRGMDWEHVAEEQIGVYRREGWYCLRQHPPVCIQKGYNATVTGSAACDWVISRGGQTVVCDLKSWSSTLRWPLEQVKDHQADHLDAASRAHLIAGIALLLDSAAWWLPWGELGPMWHRWRRGVAARGECSLGTEQLLIVGERCSGVDFLAVAVR